MAGTINFGGLASGLDTNSIIDALVNVEKIPLTNLENQAADIAAAKSTISGFSSKLSALQSAAQALADPAGFSSTTATSSDSAIVATATGVGTPGSFDVMVNAVAKEQRTYSNTFASDTTAVDPAASHTLTLQVGSGTAVNVAINAGDSLATIAANINQSGQRVSASVLFDGSQYRLQVRGLDTGAANTIAFTGDGATLLGLDNPANTFQQAQDANLTVDNITVTRPTNQITGVIPGVTLALVRQTTSPATIQVASDSTALTNKVQAFVTAYNAVVDAGHAAAGFGSQKASQTSLTGDFTIRTSLDQISSILGNVVPGTSGLYTTLGSVGLNSTEDGHLSFDQTKFATALQADPTTVSRLFVTDSTTGATGVMSNFVSTVKSLVSDPGNLFQARLDAFDAQTKELTDEETTMQTQIDAYQQQLKDQFTQMELAVSTYKNQGASLGSLTTGTTTSTTG